jgi:hypothetical protein
MRRLSVSAHSTPTVVDLQVSEDVRAFCQRHDLLEHLGRAAELAGQNFSIVGEPVVKLEQDPEDGEWYLVLEIRSRGEEEAWIQAHAAYNRAWANSTPWPAVHLITLIADLIEE